MGCSYSWSRIWNDYPHKTFILRGNFAFQRCQGVFEHFVAQQILANVLHFIFHSRVHYQRSASAKRGSDSFACVIFYLHWEQSLFCLQPISTVVLDTLGFCEPCGDLDIRLNLSSITSVSLSWSNFPSCWCLSKWCAQFSSCWMNVVVGFAFLTLGAHFLHTWEESESLCNNVNPSCSKIEFREGLSCPLQQETFKMFSVLMYDVLGCCSSDSSPEVLFVGKFP